MVQALDNLQNALELRHQRQGPGQRDRLCALCARPQPQGCDQRSALLCRHHARPSSRRRSPRRIWPRLWRSMAMRSARAEHLRRCAADVEQAAVTKVSLARSDYGSSLRDDAAVLTLAAESRPVPPIIPELAKIVAREWEQQDLYQHAGTDLDAACRPRHAGRRRRT